MRGHDSGEDCSLALELEQLTAAHGLTTASRVGQGRDLVILHSLLTDARAFDPVLPALAEKFRVTLFNLPGFHARRACPR